MYWRNVFWTWADTALSTIFHEILATLVLNYSSYLLACIQSRAFFLFSPNKYYISFWPDARAFLLNILLTQSVVDEILSQNEKEKHENHGTMLKKKVFCRVYCHFNPISQWLCFNMLFSLIIIIIDLFS